MALPTNISEATRRLNPHLFGGPTKLVAGIVMPDAEKKAIRQHKGDGMNGWEREYHATLDIQWSHIYRPVTLPLANGLTYKIDFLVVCTSGVSLVIEGHEVKGQKRAAGIAKIKMAASLYPWIRFKLAMKKRKKDGGGWQIDEVFP